MNCLVSCQVVTVILSRSNLLALLHKIDEFGDSACTIIKETDNGWTVIARSEPDDQHYKYQERGTMHPLTEAYLEKHAEDSVR